MSEALDKLSEYWLPPLVRRIATYCGKDVALKISAEYGGIHLSVPRHPDPNHRLVELLGPVDAAKLCEQFGGEEWSHVPICQAARHKLRLIRMREMQAEGFSNAAIARAVGLSERRVIAVLGKKCAAPLPVCGDLFGFE